MRLVVYAVSAACGCAPVGYNYLQRSYGPPVETASCYDNCRSSSEWGGEAGNPNVYGYGYEPTYSPYYVGGTPYDSYGYRYPRPRMRVGVQVEARNHHVKHQTQVAQVPLPKADPRKAKRKVAHHFTFPSGTVAVSD